MANRRKTHLDALEARLTGPKRIALFGHRERGQDDAAGDVLPPGVDRAGAGLRLAAADAGERRVPGREDRPDRVGRADGRDAGRDRAEAPALSRPGAVRPDRQGLPGRARHARLRRADPGVLRRLRRRAALPRPRGLGRPGRAAAAAAGGREPAGTLHRALRRRAPPAGPVALLADQVRPRAGRRPGAEARPTPPDDPSGWGVERLVETQYGMTRHALAAARARRGDLRRQLVRPRRRATAGRPPSSTRSAWKGRSAGWPSSSRPATASSSNGSGTSPPTTCPGSTRCVAAYERRYPRSDRADAVPRRGSRRCGGRGRGERSRRWRWRPRRWSSRRWRVTMPGGIQRALAFEREPDNPRRPSPGAGPSCSPGTRRSPLFWPGAGHGRPRLKQAEWTVKAAERPGRQRDRRPRPRRTAGRLKDQAPQLAPAIRKVEDARELVRHDERWKDV